MAEGEKITVMERDGRKVQTIECDQFQDPSGIAVASDGAVCVTDITAKCLFKLNSKGKLLKTVRNELQKPFSVKIIGNRVYVVDQVSQLVKIFDMDCNVVGTIQTMECPKPMDIAQGPDGLYVAGERKIGVYRCAPNGVFIRHLNLTPFSLSSHSFVAFVLTQVVISLSVIGSMVCMYSELVVSVLVMSVVM